MLFVACSGNEDVNEITLTNGGKTYGGEVKFMSTDKVQSLFPLEVVDKYSLRITGQIFESLLKIDPTSLTVKPSLATSYKITEGGTVFTFEIRKNVEFHEDACFSGSTRELTPEDVKYSLDFACSQNKLNQVRDGLVDYIKGAKEYYDNSKNSFPKGGVSGIRVIGNSVQITLNQPFVGFEKILAQPNISIFPKEAYEKYGKDIKNHPVGTGPFRFEKKDDKGIRLVRNENYWKSDSFGNQLPYLNAISVIYVNDKKGEMLAFRNREIDMLLEIPVEEIENILGSLQDAKNGKNVKHKMESSNSLSIDYIGFNTKNTVFENRDVRLAILHATDCEAIIDNFLNGDGYPPTNGFVPQLEKMNNSIRPVEVNREKARQLLAKAGYPGGKGFPELDIYVNALEGSKMHELMKGFVSQMKTELGITFRIKLCDYATRETAIASGEAKIWKAGWIADYPDPQNFLKLVYGNGTTLNNFGYSNPTYDMNYEAALIEVNPEARLAYLNKCQQQIMDDAVVIPMLMDNTMYMVNARVKGITANPMEILDFTEVFIKEPKSSEEVE